MTALKPLEARKVKGVQASTYLINDVCAHPLCSDQRGDKGHHIFPRSYIGNSSYFVLVEDSETFTIPHVTGLCQHHHEDVELHRAWIKLEDNEFVWYERVGLESGDKHLVENNQDHYWNSLGPLNPQPGDRLKRGKPKGQAREKFRGEKKRNRRTLSFSVPKDELEDGAGIIDDLLTQAKEKHGDVPDYYIYVKALYLLITED